MTRKDYILIAAALNASRPYEGIDHKDAAASRFIRQVIANDLADALACDNPRFDRSRFLQACGVQQS